MKEKKLGHEKKVGMEKGRYAYLLLKKHDMPNVTREQYL